MGEAAKAASASAIAKDGKVVSDNPEYTRARKQTRIRKEREAETAGLCLSGHGVIKMRESEDKKRENAGRTAVDGMRPEYGPTSSGLGGAVQGSSPAIEGKLEGPETCIRVRNERARHR